MLTVAQATRTSSGAGTLRNERNAQSRHALLKVPSRQKCFMNLFKTTGNLLCRFCIPAKFVMRHASHIQSRSIVIWVQFLCYCKGKLCHGSLGQLVTRNLFRFFKKAFLFPSVCCKVLTFIPRVYPITSLWRRTQAVKAKRDFRLPQRYKLDRRSAWMLDSLDLQLGNGVFSPKFNFRYMNGNRTFLN